jgi:hypothetical protein
LLLSLGVLEHGMIDAAFPPLGGLLDSSSGLRPLTEKTGVRVP